MVKGPIIKSERNLTIARRQRSQFRSWKSSLLVSVLVREDVERLIAKDQLLSILTYPQCGTAPRQGSSHGNTAAI